ncbi:hypothetical protein LAZ67_X004521 [Cordylochernes scorpioides]|uniref:Reverse transcriptase domain-containing protein n=1 Tax=Cordylochernes scorpioides TaxID=51811 RepID=A0ABY6LZ50_9ARAC|nr:hypothetical protein LAZ67_X004521 [Cordylochernes scorpioides]
MQIGPQQNGFIKGKRITNARLELRLLIEKCLDTKRPIYIYIVDFKKAFDCVKHETLIEILKITKVETRYIKIIQDFYWRQKCLIESKDRIIQEFEAKKKGRLMQHVEKRNSGITVNGLNINNIRYADDTCLLAG